MWMNKHRKVSAFAREMVLPEKRRRDEELKELDAKNKIADDTLTVSHVFEF